ncbi:MAG: hypothetical protein WAT56_01305, partial [Candidatus Microthrix parvicella]
MRFVVACDGDGSKPQEITQYRDRIVAEHLRAGSPLRDRSTLVKRLSRSCATAVPAHSPRPRRFNAATTRPGGTSRAHTPMA